MLLLKPFIGPVTFDRIRGLCVISLSLSILNWVETGSGSWTPLGKAD